MAAEPCKYEPVVTLACVNYKTIWGDKAANLKKMKDIVVRAAAEKNNIIVFPELALTGYDTNPDKTYHRKNAEPVPGPATEEMAQLARKHDVYVIFGMPEQDKVRPDVNYIAASLIGPEGIIGVYRKIHLAPPPRFTETECFAAGNELPVFETRYGKIGIQICFDFWYMPELSRILTLKGAEIIINSCASPSGSGKPRFILQQTGARASENSVFAASANLVGKEVASSFFGHSCIAGPDGMTQIRIFAQSGEDEEIVSATLNMARLRAFHPPTWYTNRRAELINREMQKLS